MDTRQATEALAGIGEFGDMPHSALTALARVARPVTVLAGQTLGDAIGGSRGAFVLLDGRISQDLGSTGRPSDPQCAHSRLVDGPAIFDRSVRFGEGIAAETVHGLHLPFDEVHPLLSRLPDLVTGLASIATGHVRANVASGAITGWHHILVMGQSNVACHGAEPGAGGFGLTHRLGRFMPLADPLEGATGRLGSVWTRFAPIARDHLGWRGLVITALARSGASIADWAPGGRDHARLVEEFAALLDCPCPVTHIVFHQGERDTLEQTDAATYFARLTGLHESVRARLPALPWLVCRASHRMGITRPEVISAQNRAIERLPGCHPGPNTDAFGTLYRRDDTHFNEAGLQAFASALADDFARITSASAAGPFDGRPMELNR